MVKIVSSDFRIRQLVHAAQKEDDKAFAPRHPSHY